MIDPDIHDFYFGVASLVPDKTFGSPWWRACWVGTWARICDAIAHPELWDWPTK